MSQSAAQSIPHPLADGGQPRFFATASLVIGIAAWCTEILAPVICFGVIGMPVKDLQAAGSDAMSDSQWGVFLVVITLALAGFLAIVGVVLGLLGATLAERSRRRAIVGICLNGLAWIAVAIFFLSSFGG